MKLKISFIQTAFACLLSLVLSSCSHSSEGGSNTSPQAEKSDIALADISDTNCFNVQKYVESVKSLYPDPTIRHITTNVTATSNGPITENYRMRLAYGNYAVSDISRESIPELSDFQQQDCNTIILNRVDGDPEVFRVDSQTENAIHFISDSGDGFTFQWVSERHMRTKLEYISGDYLCNQNQVSVTIENDYSWGTVQQPVIPESFINQDFLGIVAKVTGVSMESLYQEDAAVSDGSRMYSVAALQSMGATPVSVELNSCH